MIIGVIAKNVLDAFTPDKPQKPWGKCDGVGIGDVPVRDFKESSKVGRQITESVLDALSDKINDMKVAEQKTDQKSLKNNASMRDTAVNAPSMSCSSDNDFEYRNN